MPSLLSWCCVHTNIPADKVFSNIINTATATDSITIADDVAIMWDEGEFHPAVVKPVFGNLLLRGGVVPPRDIKDSLGDEVARGCKYAGAACTESGGCCEYKQLLYEAS